MLDHFFSSFYPTLRAILEVQISLQKRKKFEVISCTQFFKLWNSSKIGTFVLLWIQTYNWWSE